MDFTPANTKSKSTLKHHSFSCSISRTIPFVFSLAVLLGLSARVAPMASAQTPESPNVTVQSFPVGNRPEGLAFDGTSIWVVNEFDNTVTKLRASDGTIEGVFAIGREPKYLAFDGANIWATNNED